MAGVCILYSLFFSDLLSPFVPYPPTAHPNLWGVSIECTVLHLNPAVKLRIAGGSVSGGMQAESGLQLILAATIQSLSSFSAQRKHINYLYRVFSITNVPELLN